MGPRHRVPRDLHDAVRLAGWCALQVAKGEMSKDDAQAVTALLKEFRQLLKDRDADAKLAEARRLVAEMKAAKGA
jgi:hypothetical protein